LVDTSLFEAGIVQTYWQSAIALATGIAPQPMGSAHPLSAPYQAFETADGWIVIGGSNQRNWLRMLEALEAEHLADDPRFRENADRMGHLQELEAALAPYFKARASEDLLGRFEELGVPAGPVYDINQMHQDPQVLARKMVVEVEHTKLGPVRTIGLPVKFSDTPGEVAHGAPLFGQHTDEILRECGFADAEIDDLLAEGAVADR
jgi:crotonobetainyl-CoA:carnitine CoA-transferase CaiB-like acyl-CoA transferase